jgi:hypothetical protein
MLTTSTRALLPELIRLVLDALEELADSKERRRD